MNQVYRFIQLFCLAGFISLTGYAQNPIPNYSFENWTNGEPDGWQTSNSQHPGSVTQSADAQEGSSSLKLTKTDEQYSYGCANLNNMQGFTDANIYSIFAINERYSSLKLYAKIVTSPNSNCYAYLVTVVMRKAGNTVGNGYVHFENPSASGWDELNVDINYQNEEIPEEVQIAVTFGDSSINSSAHVLIDNMQFTKGLKITRPTAGQKWIAGSVDSIMWAGGDSTDQVFLQLSTDDGNTFQLVDFDIPADTGVYVLDVPDTILSTKCRVRIYDMADTTNADTTDRFKIKGYQLTKLDGNGDYIAYDISKDRWGFGNYMVHVWPPEWWQRFDYQGTDPFTGLQYSQLQGNFIFASAYSAEFPDWEAFVGAFSIDACYINTILGIYSPTALSRWEAVNDFWGGSCFGIAAANALAFSYTYDFVIEFPFFPAFTDPITVTSDTNVIPVLSQLFTHQFGNPSKQNDISKKGINPNQTLNEIKSMFYEDDVLIKTISIFNNNGSGGHTILPFELVQDNIDKQYYYLSVYDNSNPTITDALILFDTTGNSNNGSWLTTYDWTNWGGDKKIYLEKESNVYLNNAIFPRMTGDLLSPFIMSGDDLEIYTNTEVNTHIIDEQGNVTGFLNNLIFENIPNSISLSYKNGSETPPYGYSLPTDNYSVQLSDFGSDTVKTFFFTGNKTFSYERTEATSDQTDRLFFDGGVSATNPDQTDKSISLVNIINESIQEKLCVVRSIELAQNDSVKFENLDSNKVKLISYGTAKEYDIELNYAAESGLGRFGDYNIPLSANTSHIFVPDWNDLTNSQLTVLVDINNDGTIDDTLYLNNTVDVEDQGSLIVPDEYKLEQNYPNPFNPSTKIKYSIPSYSFVSIKVYNLVGEEVATLVNEEQSIGNYEVDFNAAAFSSGVYFYRIQAGSFVETKKMVLLK